MGRLGLFDVDARLELIDGEIVEMAPVGSRHFVCVLRLTRLLGDVLGEDALVSVQNPVRLDDFSEPQPDIAVLRPPVERYRGHMAAPADTLLVIEVADTTARHDWAKSVFYARNGVAENWIVDIGADAVEVLRHPDAEGYSDVTVAERGERLDLCTLPGLQVLVDDVLGTPLAV